MTLILSIFLSIFLSSVCAVLLPLLFLPGCVLISAQALPIADLWLWRVETVERSFWIKEILMHHEPPVLPRCCLARAPSTSAVAPLSLLSFFFFFFGFLLALLWAPLTVPLVHAFFLIFNWHLMRPPSTLKAGAPNGNHLLKFKFKIKKKIWKAITC